MVDYTIVEAKPWHCGQMSRLLRHEHQEAIAKIGVNTHRELRAAFDESCFRRACIVDGKVIALWGVVSPEISAYGIVWLAVAQAIRKYPIALIKEVRHQLAEMMLVKRFLICTVLDNDETAKRFAAFLGFVPEVDGHYDPPAETRFGRMEVARKLKESQPAILPSGGQVRMMAYRQPEEAL